MAANHIDQMETFKERLKRYTDRDALDTFGWMKMLIQNHHVPELRSAREQKLYQCVYLMTHAIIQTVSENMFNKVGLDGTVFFLQTFVDPTTHGAKFSEVASEVHDVRNLIAHRAYSGLQHSVEYFADDIDEKWRKDGGVLFINPALYSIQIEDVFRTSSIYAAFQNLSEKQRLQRKYKFIRKWLGLADTDPITHSIQALHSLNTTADLNTHEQVIQSEIYLRYQL